MKLNTSLTIKTKTFFYILIGMVWCQSILMQYFRAVVVRLPIIGTAPDGVIAFLYIMVTLFALREIKIKVSDLATFFLILLIYLLSPVFYESTFALWQENYSFFLLQILPVYFLGIAIGNNVDDWENIEYLLYVLSMLSVVVRIVYFFLSGNEMTQAESLFVGDMEGAYKILPHLCMIMYRVFKKMNLWNVIVLAIGSMFLLFLGNRGSVLIEVICFALMAIFFVKWKFKGLKIILIVSAILVFFYSPLFEEVILKLRDVAKNLGLSVRIFERFLAGDITDSTGRDIISNTLYTALNKNPLGYGIYADRLLSDGSYAHKIYLELWIQFGIIFGTIICGILVFVPVRAFFVAKDNNIRGLLVILYCVSVLKLFLSGSYLHEDELFMLIGLSVALLRQNRQGVL